ncbi:MAG: helix-turn-helix domain-containing protein [Bacteroidota bacterium]
MTDSEMLPKVAKKIRLIRVRKNLTLQEVSRQANISKGLLSKIENSRTVPSLPVFLSIVNTLQVPLKEFFEGLELPNGKDYLLIRPSDQQALQKEEREGFDYRFIFGQTITPATMEVALLTVQPGAKSRLTTTDGYEMKYVLSGACDYYIGEEHIRLERGDAIYFDASKPHMPVNRGHEPVVMLVIYLLTMK